MLPLIAFIYLISCFTPYVSPVHFWPMSFLALGFPYLAIVIIILSFIWLFINRKIAFFLFLLFFAGFKNLFATFALNPSPKAVLDKTQGSLRILTWNVRGFDNPSISLTSPTSVRTQMFNYINKLQPDILLLQEFTSITCEGSFKYCQFNQAGIFA